MFLKMLLTYLKCSNLLIYRDALIVPLVTGLSSLYGGFVLYSVLGYLAHKTGRQVKDFVTSGNNVTK